MVRENYKTMSEYTVKIYKLSVGILAMVSQEDNLNLGPSSSKWSDSDSDKHDSQTTAS